MRVKRRPRFLLRRGGDGESPEGEEPDVGEGTETPYPEEAGQQGPEEVGVGTVHRIPSSRIFSAQSAAIVVR